MRRYSLRAVDGEGPPYALFSVVADDMDEAEAIARVLWQRANQKPAPDNLRFVEE